MVEAQKTAEAFSQRLPSTKTSATAPVGNRQRRSHHEADSAQAGALGAP
jgi:hypothetical protein